ncbi:hypothetical protein JCM8208_000070 [Rhodotorula glutinis]
MASSSALPCLICGEPTEQRCSSCAKADVSLFFCSRDHQKLVWKAHRVVCGPGKANPFLVPPFGEDEVPYIMDACMHEFPTAKISAIFKLSAGSWARLAPHGKLSVFSILSQTGIVTAAEFGPTRVAPYVGELGAAHLLERPSASAWLALVRHWTYELAVLPAGVLAFQHYPPIYLAEAFEYGLVGWPLPDDEQPPPHPLHDEFKTRLKHRTLILATLLKNPSHRDLWPAAIQNLLDFIRPFVLLPKPLGFGCRVRPPS